MANRGYYTWGFDPEISDDQILPSARAAAFIGIGTTKLRHLTLKGMMPCFVVPSRVPGGRPAFRYRVRDLRDYYDRHGSGQQRYWHPSPNEELPICIVAALLGISEQAVKTSKFLNRLKDRKPATVRAYLLKMYLRDGFRAIKHEHKKKWDAMMIYVRRLRSLVASGRCVKCGGHLTKLNRKSRYE